MGRHEACPSFSRTIMYIPAEFHPSINGRGSHIPDIPARAHTQELRRPVVHCEREIGDPITSLACVVSAALNSVIHWIADVPARVLSWIEQVAWPAVTASFWKAENWLAEVAKPACILGLSAAATASNEYILRHPIGLTTAAAGLFLGPQILLLPVLLFQGFFLLLLAIIGFGSRGVTGGSPAALYQSLCYGGNTPASSIFTIFQSLGMKYHAITLSNWLFAAVRLISGVCLVYIIIVLVHGN
ncbi:unnamed protein product [Mycena citricolor]|uniref:Uncharacterized protein n=1 Tax=Mycena citricolor TaxID=2018698 RepID=A0AAD2HI08_9AGAR|nr:unnamed protein product [Mycena citricolor]